MLSDGEALPAHSKTGAAVARASSKKQKTEPAKLQRRQRTYSFSPSRNDSIHVQRQRGSVRPTAGQDQHIENLAWERTPTLHPTRRKSSKRRRDDHDREAEIKAMSANMPGRAVTESWAVRSTSSQHSKRAKTTGLGTHWDKPVSQVSLPHAGSVHSALSSDSDAAAFKVSALDSLAPRPTLRYTPSTNRTPPRAASAVAMRNASQTQSAMEPGPDIAHQELFHSQKRIDELADDLDAKDLRELMERDSRRRERKRIQDQERAERRLARRAERHRQAQADAQQTGTPPPENLERGVAGRELVGLGIDPPSATVTTSNQQESDQEIEPVRAADTTLAKTDESLQDAPAIPVALTEPQVPLIQTQQPHQQQDAAHQNAKLTGILHTKKSRSKSTLASEHDRTAQDDEVARKNSETSNRTSNRLSFSSLLKWGSRNQHRYSGPSSFSNTSREEMQAAAAAHSQGHSQAEALAKLQGEDQSAPVHYMVSRATATTPKRMRSRFREDLPEFPLSPPDSRVQSPEADQPLPVLAEKVPEAETQPIPIPSPKENAAAAQTRGPHLSMSLASIDSEGSWLSGRVSMAAKRDSLARANRREQGQSTGSPDSSTPDLAIADDEYMNQLAPEQTAPTTAAGRPSGEGRPSSDDESFTAADLKWGSVGAKPEVVQFHSHDRETMRSRQGLLNIDSGDEEDVEMITPQSE